MVYCASKKMTQWDFQNKGKSGWTGKSSFVLEVPLRYLRPSIIYSVPCDRIVPIKSIALMKVWLFQSYFKSRCKCITSLYDKVVLM